MFIFTYHVKDLMLYSIKLIPYGIYYVLKYKHFHRIYINGEIFECRYLYLAEQNIFEIIVNIVYGNTLIN